MLEGRHLFRLELHAYAAALEALVNDTARVRRYALDAMLFRARRHELYPAADSLERQLEMQEGIAEYTGDRLAMTLTGVNATRIATRLRKYESNPTYVRSFAYATGPALGLLLDRFAPDWRTELPVTRDPARLLATATGFHALKDMASAVRDCSTSYGNAEIITQELARDSTRKVRMADYRTRLLDGPTITLHQTNLSRSFNPQMLIGFDSTWTVYPTGSFKDKWGSLEVNDGGALVANDFRTIRLEAPQGLSTGDAQTTSGPGWTLSLAQGWSLQPVAGRVGSYEVANTP